MGFLKTPVEQDLRFAYPEALAVYYLRKLELHFLLIDNYLKVFGNQLIVKEVLVFLRDVGL